MKPGCRGRLGRLLCPEALEYSMGRYAKHNLRVAGLVGLCTVWTALGQPVGWWRSFKAIDGLAEAVCASVTVTAQGNVVVRHRRTNAVSRLDGYQAQVIEVPPHSGLHVWEWHTGQLWAAGPGGLYLWNGTEWRWYPVARPPDSAGELVHAVTPQTRLRPVRTGRVLVLLPDCLLAVQVSRVEEAQVEVLQTSHSLGVGELRDFWVKRDGSLWVSGQWGLARAELPARSVRPETPWQTWLVPEELGLREFRGLSEDGLNHLVMQAERTADGAKVVVEFDGLRWWVGPVLPEQAFRTWHGPGHELWALTEAGLWRWDAAQGQWERDETCPAREFYDVGVGQDGAFWLATSDGLLKYCPPLWRMVPVGAQNDPVLAVVEEGDGMFWLLRPDRIDGWQGAQMVSHALPTGFSWSPGSRPGIWVLATGDLVIGGGQELWCWSRTNKEWSAVAGPVPGELRALGLRKDGSLVVQGGGAVRTAAAARSVWLWRGGEWLPAEPGRDAPISEGIWNAYLESRNGDQWFSGEGLVVRIREGREQAFVLGDPGEAQRFWTLMEAPDGRVYAATLEQVWSWDEREWTLVWGGTEPLRALWCSRDGSLWLSAQEGLQRRTAAGWIAHGVEEGLPPGAVYCLWEDQRGRFWAGTAQGLMRWHPEADRDPPRSELSLQEGLRLPEGAVLTVGVRGRDRWKFTPASRLLYAYRLDAGEWSAPQESGLLMWSDLAPGRHVLQVRAVDRSGNVERSPVQREFVIQLAWYRDPRLVASVVAGGLAALFFALLALNRHRRLRRSYAEVERQVAERTRELEAAYQQLLQSQKMRALGTLAAGVAHDFNNLLSIIKGSVQIIEDHLDDPVKVQRRLDRIKTMVEQGTRVVQAMLGFSRSSQDRLVAADLNEVVRDTLLLLGERGRNTVHIDFEAQAGLPPVPMIRDLVQQILLNLLFNAVEAVGENGTILLQTGRTKDLPPGLVLQPAAAAEYCFVVVRDSGCGIAPEHLPRIFEPFFTTKAFSSRRGTGLGLTMVYEMTKRLGGGLAVESEPGRGSQFTLLLPLLPFDGMRGQESSHDAGVAAVPVPPGQHGGPDRRAM